MTNKPIRSRIEFKATATLKKFMEDHFRELDDASKTGDKKIAWCTSVGPAELLRGMGFLVYFPENHGAMLGASRMAAEMIPCANAEGYCPDICSYLTSDIGAFLQKKTPLKRVYDISSVPHPDVLVFNTNQCRDVKDWFYWYSRHLNVPAIGVHTHRDIGEIRDYQIKDIAHQIKELIPHLEAIAGEKFDLDRFREAIGSRATKKPGRSIAAVPRSSGRPRLAAQPGPRPAHRSLGDGRCGPAAPCRHEQPHPIGRRWRVAGSGARPLRRTS